MSQYRLPYLAGVICCTVVLLTGCSSSRLVDIWSSSALPQHSLKRILVISSGKNAALRRLWEDAFVTQLENHAVVATPSYRSFPTVVPDTNQIIKLIQSDGFDGVLVNRWLPAETNAEYLQGYVTKEQDMRYDRHRDRFVTYYKEVEHAGYIDSQKVDMRGIDVWTTKGEGEMIWSATSRSPEPNSPQSVRPEIAELVISDLARVGIIDPEK
jgi:hypothetical protein